MDDLHLMKFYFEEAPILKGDSRHSIDITKKFPSWVNGNTIETLITEFAYCLMAMGFDKEVVKNVMYNVSEDL